METLAASRGAWERAPWGGSGRAAVSSGCPADLQAWIRVKALDVNFELPVKNLVERKRGSTFLVRNIHRGSRIGQECSSIPYIFDVIQVARGKR